ncbi:MAG: hypothetical protein HWE39_11975 [Oceanospirillaceae bacterium]|nr:hypothetical protein [Oceanospirillaceae bacterium]
MYFTKIFLLLSLFLSSICYSSTEIDGITKNQNLTILNVNTRIPFYTSSAGTPSTNTGPSFPPPGFDTYIYTETSSGYPGYEYGKASKIKFYLKESNLNQPRTLIFYYHMHGSDIGRLQVRLYGRTIWEVSGEQHASSNSLWTKAAVPLHLADITEIEVVALSKGGYRGDIAITGVDFLPGRIETVSCKSDYSPIGTVTEKIFNSDGSLDRTYALAENIIIPQGTMGSVLVKDSKSNGVIERDYYTCTESGELGLALDEGDEKIMKFPSCWMRGMGYFDCQYQ